MSNQNVYELIESIRLIIRSSCETLKLARVWHCNFCKGRDRPGDSSPVPPIRKTTLIRNLRTCNTECENCDPVPPLAQFRLRQARALSAICRRSNEAQISYKRCELVASIRGDAASVNFISMEMRTSFLDRVVPFGRDEHFSFFFISLS